MLNRVAKVSDRSRHSELARVAKVFDHAYVKMLTPTQMLQK